VRTFEGQAAGLYFAAWKGYPLQWRKGARRYVPPHWQTIREGHSPLSDSACRAVDPANAIPNYAYSVLEGQCRQALAAEGFDLGCGFLHADQQYRDSLVYDLMELFRPWMPWCWRCWPGPRSPTGTWCRGDGENAGCIRNWRVPWLPAAAWSRRG
jgi:hypothetical protein